MTSGRPRNPHASLEMRSRYDKARKIERLLQLAPTSASRRLLEIGAGSGWISHYFANASPFQFDVDAVDVVDNRQSSDGYRFTLVADARLPFRDAAFDVVVSNHVIEHVGSKQEQALHLSEIARVLRPGGVGYLAVPNRWMLVEPHFRLAFLSWWPENLRSWWLRLWRKGMHYDCRPLSRREVEAMLKNAGFCYQQLHAAAIRLTVEYETIRKDQWSTVIRYMPDLAWVGLKGILPTLIYRLRSR